MWLGLGILGFVLFIVIAIWPARVAARKGHSFWGYFILSIFFWWITLFIVYFGLQDKTVSAKDVAADKAAETALDKEYSKTR